MVLDLPNSNHCMEKTLSCVWAKIHGFPVGIISNNGVLFTESANKAVQFIQLCNQSSTPLLFLHNITGYMVGKKAEQGGIIKAGARMINAISNTSLPVISIHLGASFGAGNYGMFGRAYKPRFLFSWPNSKCGVMGPDQLSGVLDIVFRGSMEKRGIQITPEMEKMAEERKEKMRKDVEKQIDCYHTSARGIDDSIIQITDTRNVLAFCLSVIYNNTVEGDNLYGVSRM